MTLASRIPSVSWLPGVSRLVVVAAAGLLACHGGWSLALAEEKPADGATPAATFDAQSLEFFEKEVRPLLVRRCYECHSGQSDEPKGGLRADSREDLLAGGDTGPAVVPGKPEESLLIDAVNYGDVYQMPPKSKMPAGEIEVLARWVKLGAPWPAGDPKGPAGDGKGPANEFDLQRRRASHWAWQPIGSTAPPTVRDAQWPTQPLDSFILARLEQAGLAPASQADKATLLRRVSFDLIGLPPTPAELADFLADETPQAYERVVDRLLKSTHFGERWARHWLDLVRYAETYGHEFDYPLPHATQYRNYVVRALSADVPYDQFVVEHLAGDLLTEPRRHPTEGYNESIIGTGFWFLGEATHAPVDVRGDEAGRIDNQIDVFSKTFLGLTVACARCHDHKFDAISTNDYYALAGFLQSSRRHEALLDPHDRIRAGAERIATHRNAGSQLLRSLLPPADEASGSYVSRALQASRKLLTLTDSAATPEAIAKIAEQHQLSVEQLQAWSEAFKKPAVAEADHPLQPWRVLALPAGAAQQGNSDEGNPEQATLDNEALERRRKELLDEAARARQSAEQSPLLADFGGSDSGGSDSGGSGYGPWFATGEAFGAAPTLPAQWDPASPADASASVLRAVEPGLAHSGAGLPRLQGVLRSPTFTITHPTVHLRLSGQGVSVRLVVDGYFMNVYSGLLFQGLLANVDTKGQMVWQGLGGDLRKYVGHKAYLEVIDHGDGFVAIDQIRFSAGPPPLLETNPVARQVLAGGPSDSNSTSDSSVEPKAPGPPDSLESLADAYGRRWRQALERWHAGRADAAETRWINWMLQHDLAGVSATSRQAAEEQLNQLAGQIQTESQQLPTPLPVLAMTDGSAENEQVHIRGNHKTLGDVVPRRVLTALGGDGPPDTERGSGRLQLAHRLVDPDNPLTARVMVNRIWHHLFGRGIVVSVDNFGVLGQPPTHPELLDFLAQQFVREGWSTKQLIRSLVLSRTYQMASMPEPAAEAQDPENLLLHRARIRRLEGEVIRDAILAVSGRLDATPLGGNVPVHVTAFMQGRGRPGGNGPIDGAGRRSLYIEVRRNFLPPMMLAFDTPIPFSSMGQRNVSNVPAQALILMNDPFVIEQAGVWARRLLAEPQQPARDRIRRMYLAALTREADEMELAAAEQFLTEQGQLYGLTPQQAVQDPRVWTDLCHVLFNVKEFIYVH